MWKKILLGIGIFIIGFYLVYIMAFGVFTPQTAEKIALKELEKHCKRDKLDCSIFIQAGPKWNSDRQIWDTLYHNESRSRLLSVEITPIGGIYVSIWHEKEDE